ncbi:MAG: adenosine deaminase [Candidatus Limnocylindrales bacterium]
MPDRFRRLPKAELHLHLDGALRPVTALELGQERRLVETAGLDLAGIERALVAPLPCRDQAELLRAFDLPLAILQDAEALERAAHELVLDLATDGIVYAEIRWAPGLHTRRGLDLREGTAAVMRGARAGVAAVAAVARAASSSPTATGTGAEPPIAIRLIAVAMRSAAPAESERIARLAATFSGEGLTGFDLAGPEAAFPDVAAHRRAFAIARAAGLGLTVHAGEWGGAPQVRRALVVEPDRIAHGAPAADDPGLMAVLRQRGISLDICPTSNWQAGLVPTLAAHPLPRLVGAGVPVTLSTDDPTVSAVTLSEEYRRAHELLGLGLPALAELDRRALAVAFLHDDEPLRRSLADRLATFLAADPAWQP